MHTFIQLPMFAEGVLRGEVTSVDEKAAAFLHHRGQLHAYPRQMGVAPPMLWDFENNAPGHRPRAPQTA